MAYQAPCARPIWPIGRARPVQAQPLLGLQAWARLDPEELQQARPGFTEATGRNKAKRQMQPKFTCSQILEIFQGNCRETQLTRLDPDTCSQYQTFLMAIVRVLFLVR